MNVINEIRLIFEPVIAQAETFSRRDYYNLIAWDERLIGILGAKGVGKTTLLFQRYQSQAENSLYLSLDHGIATTISLPELAHEFYVGGGRLLLLDEVHKYPDWSIKIKNIYDTLPGLKVVFSGSSAIRINAEKGDLSRRASIYNLPVLSLREFISFETNISLEKVRLEKIFEAHQEIATKIVSQLQPVPHFKNYLRHGAYPFYRDGLARFWQKLHSTATYALETDLVQIYQLSPQYIPRLKKLLQLVASSVPCTPNISALAGALEMSRASVLRYLQVLEAAGIISLLEPVGRGYQKLCKPEKIYLDNTNLLYAFSGAAQEIGTLRETFCLSQLRAAGYQVLAPRQGDFLISEQFTIEVGGKNKKGKQVRGADSAFVVRDDIEVGTDNIVPLWLLGFLY